MKHIHTKYLGSTRPFLAMAEPKKVSLCSFGLAKTFLCAMLAASPILTYAQNGEEAATTDEDGKKVHVAFREVEKDDLLGGVSVVDVKELTKKNFTTYSMDNMQGYVGGWNGASLWGYSDALILVDGVPRSANNVKTDEIETITFMKGAQAVVLYGSKGANGVVLITTKRGQRGDMRINVRANTGWDVAKSFPTYLSAAEYMTYYNKARQNDGLGDLYSATDIYNYGSGLNPYRYPDVNFYSGEYIGKVKNTTNATAEIEGGGKFATYYANIGYERAGDYFKFGEAADNFTQRLNVRGNVDMRLNDDISAYVNTTASFYDSRSANGGSYWEAAASFRPNRVAPLIPTSLIDPNASSVWEMLGSSENIFNGCFLGGTQNDMTNMFGNYYAAGNAKYTSRNFTFDVGLDFSLDKLVKGLSFHTMFAVDYATSYTTSYNNSYATYSPIWSSYGGKEVIVGLEKFGLDERTATQNISGSADTQTINFNAHFDYARTFGGVHNVSAMLLANGYQQTVSGEYHRTSNANLGLNLSYDYAKKYFATFGMAAIHSAKLAEGHREALSPSMTLGWNISKEKFMEGSIFNDLMLSASLSQLNTDFGIDEYYMYSGSYTQNSSAWWGWRDGISLNPAIVNRGANENLTFLKRKEFSVNLRASMLDNRLTADLSWFTSTLNGKVIRPTNMYPNYMFTYWPEASFIPYVNYDNDKRNGFDISVNYKEKFGEVEFMAGANFTYYNTEATKRDDSSFSDTYQYRQGKPLDAIWGYECIGYFTSPEDVLNSPSQAALSGNIKKGDLKYKDQNNDGIIDTKDQIYLGKGGWYGSPYTIGVNLSAKWKGFTLFVLATGGWGGKGVKNNSYYWISGENKYSEVVRGAWTEETAATATYPRLTTQDGANNNTTSTYWLYSTDALRLSKVQLTYDFANNLFQNTWIKGVSAYISGSNLLTIAPERKILEMNVGSAPQTRFYNMGVKMTF